MKMKNYFFIFYALFAFNFEIAFGAECDEKSKPIDCYQYAIEKLQMAVSQIKNLEKQMTDLAKVQKEIASLKEELKAQETRIDAKFQKETASLKEELKAQETRIDAKLRNEIMMVKKNMKLKCITVTEIGQTARCPEGYIVTGCTAGMNRGSYTINDNSCQTQSGVDWTCARCCKIDWLLLVFYNIHVIFKTCLQPNG